MLSVVIATNESERALGPTLAALVPGATAGLVREVILADAGSRDATADVADIAGCRMLVSGSPLAQRLTEAAAAARAPWLLFIEAGVVPQTGWVEETFQFIEATAPAGNANGMAAVFRAVSPSVIRASPLQEAVLLLVQASGLLRPKTHGLLVGKELYRRMSETVTTGEPADILRRLGRQRVITLRCGAVVQRPDAE